MHWQKIWRNNLTSWEELCAYIGLPLTEPSSLRFPLNLPRRLADKIEKGNREDPLFKQFVPDPAEGISEATFVADPLGEAEVRCSPKGLKKYAHRFLILTSSACAMHCRYCFRHEFPYEKSGGFEGELAKIGEDPSIQEVILSGGDPLSLNDRALGQLLEALARFPHVKRVRFHSRFLIGIPERVTPGLLSLLSQAPFQIWFVLHCNHPREWDEEVGQAVMSLRKRGIPLLNQSVLLKGVNDSVEVLAALYELLINQGIKPYYLHQLDQVSGSGHFYVPVEKGKALMHALSLRLPGYALPTYVTEQAGALSKIALLGHFDDGGGRREHISGELGGKGL